ncbi:hypothetical protein T12_803 [Trichinella patagoniensis]|uniref:Legume lectin domain-containing protein n=1 Tax=Trichinella patagoniensis TaxID=990121 RepID=A0A0V0XI81_9BILA|nr:hypothetical protein T12_803 [Trichinella patagoniensis]
MDAEFEDINDNHVGVDLNFMVSAQVFCKFSFLTPPFSH